MPKKLLSGKAISSINFGSFFGISAFIIGYTYEEVIKFYKKHKAKEWLMAMQEHEHLMTDQTCWGFAGKVTIEGDKYFLIFIRNSFNFNDDKEHAKLAHEVLHLCSFNLVDMFDPMKENEAFCYTHTHVMNQCYEILRKTIN